MLLVAGVAHADPEADALQVKAAALMRELHDTPDATDGLHLDPALRLTPSSAGLTQEHQQRTYALGHHTTAKVEGTWWSVNHDVPVRGWRASISASHDFGFARLSATAATEHVDTDLGHGTFTDVGLSLSRSARLSRWMTGWVGLSVGYRHWLDQQRQAPPAGETDATQLTLSIGTTFK